ncbi:hypothetical protein N7466_005669 [Penicillium verhagenii]|uniref:uncharacterized protein n=1 Tax=Penicillium verhagenii TaxID=1562060 RepID=UPI0025458006|nr:uncharacterized protein N7466_005669 [Penicillium verhagenii]KAJ5930176.1 hypothetical protein N7466_005669 [Penicillium verhagenii]
MHEGRYEAQVAPRFNGAPLYGIADEILGSEEKLLKLGDSATRSSNFTAKYWDPQELCFTQTSSI